MKKWTFSTGTKAVIALARKRKKILSVEPQGDLLDNVSLGEIIEGKDERYTLARPIAVAPVSYTRSPPLHQQLG